VTTPVPPGVEYVFTISADIAPPRSAGAGLWGERLHIPIIGGKVSGPRLEGKILPGGSDWPVIRPDGASAITAHYSVEADDGTLIVVKNEGLRVSTPEVLARLRAGEAVDPSEYYFRTAPVFDAPDGPHQWLRESLFICSLAPRAGGVEVAVYRVT
jgi:hypothetical protein